LQTITANFGELRLGLDKRASHASPLFTEAVKQVSSFIFANTVGAKEIIAEHDCQNVFTDEQFRANT
jgi:hypothetical protein